MIVEILWLIDKSEKWIGGTLHIQYEPHECENCIMWVPLPDEQLKYKEQVWDCKWKNMNKEGTRIRTGK